MQRPTLKNWTMESLIHVSARHYAKVMVWQVRPLFNKRSIPMLRADRINMAGEAVMLVETFKPKTLNMRKGGRVCAAN